MNSLETAKEMIGFIEGENDSGRLQVGIRLENDIQIARGEIDLIEERINSEKEELSGEFRKWANDRREILERRSDRIDAEGTSRNIELA